MVRDEEATYDAPRRREHVTMLDDDVVEEVLHRCGFAAAGVYLYLERRADTQGKCHPSIATIAEAGGSTERYVTQLINEKLIPSGFVQRQEIKNRFGRTQGVEYTLPYHRKPHEYGGEHTPEQVGEHRGERMGEPDRQSSSPKVDTGSISEVDTSTPSPRRKRRESGLSPEQQARFDRWYASYPRKVKRAEAETAWQNLNPDDALTDHMISVVGLWATSKDWTKEDGRFVPYPASWLNGKRWQDEAPRAPQTKPERVIRHFG